MTAIGASSKGALRRRLVGLMVLLLVPTAVLVSEAWRQVRWEGLHQQQVLARELVAAINRSLERLRRGEAAIDFDEYAFATTAANLGANVIQRSRLSDYPVADVLPGIVGRFQVTGDGALSTPLLPPGDPAEFGVDADEYVARQRAEAVVLEVLKARPVTNRESPNAPARDGEREELPAEELATVASSREAGAEPVPEAKADVSERRDKALFDRLAQSSTPASASPPVPRRQAAELPVADRAVMAEAEDDAALMTLPAAPEALSDARLRAIDAALDTLSFQLLDSGHFLLFRRRFRDGERYLQGAALAREEFLQRVVAEPFLAASVAAAARLEVRWGDAVLGSYGSNGSGRSYRPGPAPLDGELLHEERLLSPFDGLQLRFVTTTVPAGPGAAVVLWSAAVLVLLMIVSFHVLYRAGVRQLDLARQQQDFVSAVSHELRTPLTSIRMYSEMLRAGWADEAKRRSYYDHIHDESERLSRLVANVLQLSRMSRTGLDLELVVVDVAALIGRAEVPLEQVAAAGEFTLRFERDGAADRALVEVDLDAMLQVLLNLVDNAVKFGGASTRREVEISTQLVTGRVEIAVRDYGPGLPPGDPERLFELFHRPAEGAGAPGTGIGLALVRGLTEAMGGKVRASNADPGAVFRISLPRKVPA